LAAKPTLLTNTIQAPSYKKREQLLMSQNLLFKSRVVPVVEIQRANLAIPLADALLAGGIDVIEITLRTEAALESIAIIAKERPQLVVAAGTVLNANHLDASIKAGAKIIFSPGNTASLLKQAQQCGVPFFPGVATPSEVMHCLEHGITNMKLFPADAINSLKLLKAFSSPLAQARFIPTGGINENNIHEFVVQANVLAVGASAVAPRDSIQRADWIGITQRAKTLLGLAATI
jgi:2-dehydro-3-deoxyphosphogluconate aldolase / (4S)-4-hydroxy-2-oxoglutarate aldolase